MAKPTPAQRRIALRTFKQRGYVVQVGAIEHILDTFAACETDDNFPAFLDRVLDALLRLATASILSAKAAETAVAHVTADIARNAGTPAAALELVDLFSLPRRRSGAGSEVILDAPPEAKALLFRARYEMILEKTLRNPRFTPPATTATATSGSAKSPYLQLTAIDSLQGTRGDKLVLGMLTQLEEDTWYLEDLNGSVQVDLSEAHTTAGLHTDSSFVIAQGELVDFPAPGDAMQSIFKVFAMGTPPLEPRDTSMQALGKDANLFGGRFDPTAHESLLVLEQNAADSMFLIVSDVYLDNPRVMAGLRLIFEGYLDDGVVPTAIVLMGSFLSHPFGQQSADPRVLATAFTDLGRMIASDFPQLAEATTFVLIPGPNDAGPGNILPRPPMPKILTSGFVAALSEQQVMLATNPCRLRYMTQEIVILREDLLHKMLRHCAVKPDLTDTGHMAEHMVKSVIDQSYLCPLPLPSRPIMWAHDHALWLFPAPHLVVVADKVDGYTFKYGETIGMNPGSFGTDLSFAIYLPAERRSQQCTLNPDELAGFDDNANGHRGGSGAQDVEIADDAEGVDAEEDVEESEAEDGDEVDKADEEENSQDVEEEDKDEDEEGVENEEDVENKEDDEGAEDDGVEEDDEDAEHDEVEEDNAKGIEDDSRLEECAGVVNKEEMEEEEEEGNIDAMEILEDARDVQSNGEG
jgi:DNA polymerase epsilon subunit 2